MSTAMVTDSSACAEHSVMLGVSLPEAGTNDPKRARDTLSPTPGGKRTAPMRQPIWDEDDAAASQRPLLTPSAYRQRRGKFPTRRLASWTGSCPRPAAGLHLPRDQLFLPVSHLLLQLVLLPHPLVRQFGMVLEVRMVPLPLLESRLANALYSIPERRRRRAVLSEGRSFCLE